MYNHFKGLTCHNIALTAQNLGIPLSGSVSASLCHDNKLFMPLYCLSLLMAMSTDEDISGFWILSKSSSRIQGNWNIVPDFFFFFFYIRRSIQAVPSSLVMLLLLFKNHEKIYQQRETLNYTARFTTWQAPNIIMWP